MSTAETSRDRRTGATAGFTPDPPPFTFVATALAFAFPRVRGMRARSRALNRGYQWAFECHWSSRACGDDYAAAYWWRVEDLLDGCILGHQAGWLDPCVDDGCTDDDDDDDDDEVEVDDDEVEVDDDEVEVDDGCADDVSCPTCQGTGIGPHGPDSSCSACGGVGYRTGPGGEAVPWAAP